MATEVDANAAPAGPPAPSAVSLPQPLPPLASSSLRRDLILAGLQALRNVKIQVSFRPISGNVATLKDPSYWLSGDLAFRDVEAKVKTKLRMERIYMYLQNSFTPDPGDKLADLFKCFKGPGEKLAFSYSNEPAYS